MLAITAENPLHSLLAPLAELATERAIRIGPIEATVTDVDPAGWHVARVVPGQERIAAAHLAGRRFGVFLPDAPVYYRIGPALRHVVKLILPGYLLVWTWPSARNWNRIMACPGVLGLISRAGDSDGKPVVIDAEFVNTLRSFSATAWHNPPTVAQIAYPPKRKGKNKKGKKARSRKTRP